MPHAGASGETLLARAAGGELNVEELGLGVHDRRRVVAVVAIAVAAVVVGEVAAALAVPVSLSPLSSEWFPTQT